MNERWLIEDFAVAVKQLEAAILLPADNDVVKAGCIQYFEFCFELAWKSIKVISASQGSPDCLSPKSCLRQAYTNGWISHESVWLDMLDARNKMSHTYNAQSALVIYRALPNFLPELKILLQCLQGVIAVQDDNAR